jgi:hypothetical protein
VDHLCISVGERGVWWLVGWLADGEIVGLLGSVSDADVASFDAMKRAPRKGVLNDNVDLKNKNHKSSSSLHLCPFIFLFQRNALPAVNLPQCELLNGKKEPKRVCQLTATCSGQGATGATREELQ